MITPRPLLLGFIAASLFAASCGASEPGGYDVADRVIAEVGQPEIADPIDESECERSTVVDEYGFEQEILDCPDGAEPIPAETEAVPLEDIVATVPDPEMLSRFESIQSTISEIDAACGNDFERWRSSVDTLATQADEAVQRINDGALDGYTATPDAVALGHAIFDRVVLETGCANPGGGEAFGYDQAIGDGTLAITSRTLLGSAELSRLLQGAVMSDLFHFFSTLPNYEWMRAQQDPIDVIVYGTSQAGAAIEGPVLADLTGLAVGNAFLPGSLVEVQQYWFPEVDLYVNPSRVVWLMGAIDLLIDCEPNDRPQQFLDRLSNRRRAMANSGWFNAIDPISVILGPPGEQRAAPGNGEKKEAPDPDALAAHLAEYEDRLGNTEFCVSRAEVIAASAQRMVDNGQDVFIVGAPLNPAAAQLNPELLAETASALTELRTYLPAEVHVVDLSATMQDPATWADLTHPTLAGATEFSGLVAEALEVGDS